MTRRYRTVAAAVVVVVTAVLLSGCATVPWPRGSGASASSSSTPRASATGGAQQVAGATYCPALAAAALRLRTHVDADGAVTVDSGGPLCAPVTLYSQIVQLDASADLDTTPAWLGSYDPGQQFTDKVPAVSSTCQVGLVFALASPDTVATATEKVREDAASLPADLKPKVADSTVIGFAQSIVVAVTTKGDPATCAGAAGGAAVPATSPCSTVDEALTAAVAKRLSVKGSTVTVGSGPLPCSSVDLWVATFDLSQDATEDPDPVLVRQVTDGGDPVSFVLPAPGQTCHAVAVYVQDPATTTPDATAAREAMQAWAKNPKPALATAAFQKAHPDAAIVMGLSISGPCSSDTNSVSTPTGKVRDCWLSSAGGLSGSLKLVDTTYTAVSCSQAHTHEVYWVETPKAAAYDKAYPSHGTPPATWARKRSNSVCDSKQSSIRLASGVRASTIGVSYLWPTDLIADPKADGYAESWADGQIVCLVRRLDGKPRTSRILR